MEDGFSDRQWREFYRELNHITNDILADARNRILLKNRSFRKQGVLTNKEWQESAFVHRTLHLAISTGILKRLGLTWDWINQDPTRLSDLCEARNIVLERAKKAT